MREELATARSEADKLRVAMNLKSDEVSLLRGHVSAAHPKHKPIDPTTKPGRGEVEELVENSREKDEISFATA